MSRITKLVVAVLATVVVAVGAIVVYRETDLLTGSLVVLAALMIVGLLARRVAVREEKEGMAEWEREAMASAAAAEDLFGDWKMSSPRGNDPATPPTAAMPPSPTVAPPVPGVSNFPAPPLPRPPATTDPSTESATNDSTHPAGLPVRGSDHQSDRPTITADRQTTGAERRDEQSTVEARTPAYAGAPAAAAQSSATRALIDWSGQGRTVNEQVHTSDDIMKASDATALPSAAVDPAAGSELSRLLAKVEARLREYD